MKDKASTYFSAEQIEAAENQIFEHSKRIEFYITEYSIELLAQKMQNKDFFVPPYQREFTWELDRKSRFIESLLMGLPVPFLFFWENPTDGRLEIVDGSQRLRTIEEFLDNRLKLGDLDQLSLASGFKYNNLPNSRQRKLKNRSIRGIILNEHADKQSRFDLFERINTGSKAANKAEIRRGALSGPFQDLVIRLAKNAEFIKLAPVSEKQRKEREREELVTRFFAYGDGLADYRDRVAQFLFAYTQKMNTQFTEHPEEIEKYQKRFELMIHFISQSFKWGFRKSSKGRITPRSRFEAIAIGSYEAIQIQPNLVVDPESVQKWLISKEFRDVTGADGANAQKRLKGRIKFVKDHLLAD